MITGNRKHQRSILSASAKGLNNYGNEIMENIIKKKKTLGPVYAYSLEYLIFFSRLRREKMYLIHFTVWL